MARSEVWGCLSSGCEAEWHRPGGLSRTEPFLPLRSLEAWLVLARALCQVADGCLVAVPSLGERVSDLPGGFDKGTNPIEEGSAHITDHLPKVPPPSAVALGVRISTQESGGAPASVHYLCPSFIRSVFFLHRVHAHETASRTVLGG